MPGRSPFFFVTVLSYDSYTKMLDLALAHIDTEAKCSGSPPSFASFHALRLFCIGNLTISGSGVMPEFCKAQGILFSDHPLHRLDNRTNMIGTHIQTPLRVMQKTPISAMPTATSSSSSSSSSAVQHTRAFVFSRMLLETQGAALTPYCEGEGHPTQALWKRFHSLMRTTRSAEYWDWKTERVYRQMSRDIECV